MIALTRVCSSLFFNYCVLLLQGVVTLSVSIVPIIIDWLYVCEEHFDVLHYILSEPDRLTLKKRKDLSECQSVKSQLPAKRKRNERYWTPRLRVLARYFYIPYMSLEYAR